MGKQPGEYEKGRGAQIAPTNRFSQYSYAREHAEGIDDWEEDTPATQVTEVFPKTIVNEVKSPDLRFENSLNPYQGCEHGCIYCYARVTHQYWGYSAGTDFEQKILVKKNAVELLEKFFSKKNYQPKTLMLSGNTDCYQPIEKKYGITRKILELCANTNHPVGIITKNSLIQRDADILEELAKNKLTAVNISLTTLDESLRRIMEPRTATSLKKLETIALLAGKGIPVNVMIAPIIPALNDTEIFTIAQKVADAGARSISYTTVRLNGEIGDIFTHWVNSNFPQRAEKVLHQIQELHGGNLNDSDFSRRMRGSGNKSEQIKQMMALARKKFFPNYEPIELRTDLFLPPSKGQYRLF